MPTFVLTGFKGYVDLILFTLSTSVGFAKEDDKTPDTTPQNTLITIVSSEEEKKKR